MKGQRFMALLLAAVLSLSVLAGVQAEQEEYFLEKEEGCRQLTLYWNDPSTDYSKCDVWVWFPGKDGSGHLFYPCEYGVKCMINVPQDVSEVGFIVRKNCSAPGGKSWGNATKDVEEDRYAVMTGDDTKIYLLPGDSMQYTSPDGGKTLNAIRTFNLAGIVSPNQIKYFINPACKLDLTQVHVLEGGRELPILDLSSRNSTVITGVITVDGELDISKPYTVRIDGYGEVAAMPTEIFDSPAFVEQYTYEGDDLGAVIQGDETVFKVWAPTAASVRLNLFADGSEGSAYETLEMTRADKGVWTASAPCGHGTYYTYTVATASGVQEAVDPYARAVGVNGDRGMVIDLASTDPEGFRNGGYYDQLDTYSDAVIWEVHVRDFSNTISGSAYPGKYLAFTETGLTNDSGAPAGLDYLKQLGITHVHLQPVYDFATVDEASSEPQFNWGYDPKNYNAPEGSYSTDPFHGEVRVNEFKRMVQSLHDNGIGVVMDVVYNHTYALDSWLNRIVPYYYYRFNYDGTASNGSGCGNETASNRAMFRKYMVDSVKYWAQEYQVDGFRFDLMALHDIGTMQAIERAVHEINPKALIYGEGWTGGTSALLDNAKASQANIRLVWSSEGAIGSVAVFNDAIRDGLKGSVFDSKDRGYANGSANKLNANKVMFGIQGGEKNFAVNWSVNDAMVVNYVSSHDNNTLWDKLLASNPDASEKDRLAMYRLCAATVLLSRGTPFFLAGEEMLRTKQGDGNSYKSSDEVNNLNWNALAPDSEEARMAAYYQGLIHLRRARFTDPDAPCAFLTTIAPTTELLGSGAITVSWADENGTAGFAVINPIAQTLTINLPEDWTSSRVMVQGDKVLPDAAAQDGPLTVEPCSVTLAARAD